MTNRNLRLTSMHLMVMISHLNIEEHLSILRAVLNITATYTQVSTVLQKLSR